jgi:2-polyprenyl-6-hydroxyphenyl methylase/3-demethylubiquinone-9 3-methyltransferase
MVAGDQLAAAHAEEVARGQRFEFGANWQRFLEVLDEERIAEAELSLSEMLGVKSLAGRRFLDVGSGSGLFSLAAMRLGADQVRSFDYDPASVACTAELRRRYFAEDPRWSVGPGSALDDEFAASLGRWDIVYSWGVLHHTGAMWRALDITQRAVAENGLLFISIYNDQGVKSRAWLLAKRVYNRLPSFMRLPFTAAVMGPRELLSLGFAVVRGKPGAYVRAWTNYKRARGMSRWHDIVDWIGGYPFEVAKPEEVFDFLKERGFTLERLFTCAGGIGCNQYVFRRR